MANPSSQAWPIRTAQVLGVTSAAFLAGKTFSQSFSATPALLAAPAPLLARQWKVMSSSDKYLAPALAVLSSGIFSLLAFQGSRPSTCTQHAADPLQESSVFFSSNRRLYDVSTILLINTIIWPLLALEPINKKLERKAAEFSERVYGSADVEAKLEREETTHYLVDRWAAVNLGRAVMSGVAACCATWAAVGPVVVVTPPARGGWALVS